MNDIIKNFSNRELLDWANGPSHDEKGYRTVIKMYGYYQIKDPVELLEELSAETSPIVIASLKAWKKGIIL